MEEPQAVDGRAPLEVAGLPAQEQRDWFVRHRNRLTPQPTAWWRKFYCDSLQHRGLCCDSCLGMGSTERGLPEGDCCCLASANS